MYFEKLPQAILSEILSLLDFSSVNKDQEETNKQIKYTNKLFHKTYHTIRNIQFSELCKKSLGFEPPLEKAALIGKICAFIETSGEQIFSNLSKESLAQSANKILQDYLQHAWANYYLALLHLTIIKPPSEKLIAQYCMISAGLGFPPALFLLAQFYRDGEFGFAKNEVMMEKNLLLAIKKNHKGAKVMLGYEYLKKNKIEAGLKQLEECNEIESLFMLGELYRDGMEGIEANKTKAIGYFDRAIKLGSSEVAKELADNFLCGKGCILPDLNKHNEYLIRHYEIEINKKNVAALRKLGLLYLKNKHKEEAISYLSLAASHNDGMALFLMAYHYRTIGNKSKAIEYYKKAFPLLIKGVEKINDDERKELESAKEDGLWLIVQGELRLGTNYISHS